MVIITKGNAEIVPLVDDELLESTRRKYTSYRTWPIAGEALENLGEKMCGPNGVGRLTEALTSLGSRLSPASPKLRYAQQQCLERG